MKKSLIMGATSLVLAATPVFGVFAATGDPAAVTDNLKVTVTEICRVLRRVIQIFAALKMSMH